MVFILAGLADAVVLESPNLPIAHFRSRLTLFVTFIETASRIAIPSLSISGSSRRSSTTSSFRTLRGDPRTLYTYYVFSTIWI